LFFDLVDDVADGRLSSIEHAVVAVFHIIHGMSRAMEVSLLNNSFHHLDIQCMCIVL
jgi:hypothetical protein